jgi:N-acetyl-S-(2-succino)cysteine monooxygenase
MHSKGQMRLGAFFNPTGHHVASWRHPDAQADAGINFQHYIDITRKAERAKFDLCAPLTIEQAQTFYRIIKARMTDHGRSPDEMKIMPELSAIVGRTAAEAQEKYEFLQSLIHPIVAREILSTVLGGVDLTPYPFDGSLPDDLPMSNASRSTFDNMRDIARREHLTIRQVAMRVAGARGKSVIKGSPVEIADQMEEWFRRDACDGFNIKPPYLPGGLDDFVELVIPELQRRGLFRTEYEGRTLRENLGLSRPPSRYAKGQAKSERKAATASAEAK